MSNLKQIGLACSMYSDDYNDYLMPTYMNVAADGSVRSTYWMFNYYSGISGKYGLKGSSKVFCCPSDPRRSTYPWAASSCSYGVNLYLNTRIQPPTYKGKKQGRFRYPSQTLYWGETRLEYATENWVNLVHSGGANCLFLDYHVEWKAKADIPTSTSNVFWDGD